MARYTEFYRGRRKRRNYAFIPFVIALALVAVVVVLFYGMQKYAVITKDGVDVVLPGMEREETVLGGPDGELPVFDEVPVTLVIENPDYSGVKAVAGKDVEPLRAIFIASEDLNSDNLFSRAAQLNSGNALVLEMKPRSGYLKWTSNAKLAVDYGLMEQNELADNWKAMILGLQQYAGEQEKEIRLVAQISCCVDSALATRSADFALRNAAGFDIIDDTGYWLDPYNTQLRSYIVELVRELYDLGFDEVVLADVAHPVVETPEGQDPMQFLYSKEMSTVPTPENAVCGFALYVANELADRSGGLGIYTGTRRSLVGLDEGTGQNAPLFLKVYDRVWFRTDRYEYTFNYQDIEKHVSIGSANDRFIPVVINYLPDNSSWVYIEDLEALNG